MLKSIIRKSVAEDAVKCGEICFSAFRTIAEKHGFPPDFPSTEVATGLLAGLIAHPGYYAVTAEIDGKIIGSNFLDERSPIAGIGPITISPDVQNNSAGRDLMTNVMDRVTKKGFLGVRLLQAAYNTGSLSLYAKLGFNAQASLAVMQGGAIAQGIAGYSVRPATEKDLPECDALCVKIHGHHRSGELLDAIQQGLALVVEHETRIVGYSTGVAFFGHSVAESNEGLKALIGAAAEFQGPGILVPIANHELFRWCLQNGLRTVFVMNLMTIGLYKDPDGAYLPSVLY